MASPGAGDDGFTGVAAWLVTLGLNHRRARYEKCLAAAGLTTAPVLACTTDDTLRLCGVAVPAHRRLLLASAAEGFRRPATASTIAPELSNRNVHDWLNTLDLALCADALTSAGYETLADVVGATTDDLQAAGVALPGSRKKMAVSIQRNFAARPASILVLTPSDAPLYATASASLPVQGATLPVPQSRPPSQVQSRSRPSSIIAPAATVSTGTSATRDVRGYESRESSRRASAVDSSDSEDSENDLGMVDKGKGQRESGHDVFNSSGTWELVSNPLARSLGAGGNVGPQGRKRSSSDAFVGGGTHRFAVTKVVSQGFIRIPMTLVVDVECGTVTILKKHEGFQSAITNQTDKPYGIDSVRQLIKSRSEPARLGILFGGKARKDYRFDTPRSRERFCEMVERMRTVSGSSGAGSADAPVDDDAPTAASSLTVLVGTWNMGNADPPSDISAWVRPGGSGSPAADICAFGTQEETMGESEWAAMVLAACGDGYELLQAYSLWYMRLVVVVRSAHRDRVSHLQMDSVATGIGNALGNKENSARRNSDFAEIVRGLRVGRPQSLDITARFHHLFWCGDLNYRVDVSLDDALALVHQRDWVRLMAADQLSEERRCGRAFVGFVEREPTFPPTYRYARGTRLEYASKKVTRKGIRINVPSYCDRILSLSFPNLVAEQLALDCVDSIMTSDHSPVYALFSVGIARQFVAPASPDNAEGEDFPPAVILFGEAVCKVRAAVHAGSRFALEMHSPCLVDGMMRTKQNRLFVSPRPESAPSASGTAESLEFSPTVQSFQGCVRPAWTESDFSPMPTLFPHPAYVRAQHLQIAVLDEAGQVLGQCVVSLACVIGPRPVPFSALLTQSGTDVGYLRGTVRVHVPRSLKIS